MRIVTLAVVLAVFVTAQAQEADTLRAADGWRSSLVASLAGNQAAFSNWQEGGVSALAATAEVDGQFDRVVGSVLTTQELRLALGVLRQDTLALRKALDVARYAVTAELASDRPIRPAVSATVRSQFAPGYDYAPAAADYPSLSVVPGQALKVSDALAPLVFAQTVGLAYRPGNGLVGRLGLGLKETVVAIERLRPVYGNALDEAVRVEAGVDAELALERPLAENVTLRSRLAAFQGFSQIGAEAPDVVFENGLVLKVNDVLNVRIEGTALYDADVSADVQLREVLSVGVSLGLL
ncbi:DUF3078 domain-containing protein [Rubrivirga sp.]|uniref:DUF3078 domain-containing protein n=1 Tax=Rubrivirga sp. TaxID=1885344 RepID=UPI003B52AA69